MTHDLQIRLITDIESELINCLLECPKIEYPWTPADPDFSLEGLSDEELQDRSQAFLTKLQSYWTDVDSDGSESQEIITFSSSL
jgi:hypothetical protein